MASVGFTSITQECYGHASVTYPDFLIAPHARVAAAATAPATPAPVAALLEPDKRMSIQPKDAPITKMAAVIYAIMGKYMCLSDVSRVCRVSFRMAWVIAPEFWGPRVISLSIPPHLDIAGTPVVKFRNAFHIFKTTSLRLETVQEQVHYAHFMQRSWGRILPWLTEEEQKGALDALNPSLVPWTRAMSKLPVIPEDRAALHFVANRMMVNPFGSLIEMLARLNRKEVFKAQGNVCLTLLGDLAVRKNPKRNKEGQAVVSLDGRTVIIPEKEFLPARAEELRKIAYTRMELRPEVLNVMLEKVEAIFTRNLFAWRDYLVTVDVYQMDALIEESGKIQSMSREQYEKAIKNREIAVLRQKRFKA